MNDKWQSCSCISIPATVQATSGRTTLVSILGTHFWPPKKQCFCQGWLMQTGTFNPQRIMHIFRRHFKFVYNSSKPCQVSTPLHSPPSTPSPLHLPSPVFTHLSTTPLSTPPGFTVLGSLASVGQPEANVGQSGASQGPVWASLGPVSASLGPVWASLGPVWASLGAVWGLVWGQSGAST